MQKEVTYKIGKPEDNVDKAGCPILYALGIVGSKWKLPILWHLFDQETTRYNELKRSVPGITNIMDCLVKYFGIQLRAVFEAITKRTFPVINRKFNSVEYIFRFSDIDLFIRDIIYFHLNPVYLQPASRYCPWNGHIPDTRHKVTVAIMKKSRLHTNDAFRQKKRKNLFIRNVCITGKHIIAMADSFQKSLIAQAAHLISGQTGFLKFRCLYNTARYFNDFFYKFPLCHHFQLSIHRIIFLCFNCSISCSIVKHNILFF